MRILKLFFIMIFFSFGLLFLMQNYEVFRTHFQLSFSLPGVYAWNTVTEMPYYSLLIGSFALGMLLCIGIFFLSSLSNIAQNIKTAGRIRALEAENIRLKAEIKTKEAEEQKRLTQKTDPTV